MGTSFSIWRQLYTGKSLNSHITNTHIYLHMPYPHTLDNWTFPWNLLSKVNAGEVLAFDYRTLHRALEHGGSNPRPLLYYTFTKRWLVTCSIIQRWRVLFNWSFQHFFCVKKSLQFLSSDFLYFSGSQTRWILPTCQAWRRPTILSKESLHQHQHRISTFVSKLWKE